VLILHVGLFMNFGSFQCTVKFTDEMSNEKIQRIIIDGIINIKRTVCVFVCQYKAVVLFLVTCLAQQFITTCPCI